MTEENKNIKHYTPTDIQNYVDGKLTAAEMHAMEKAALDDSFLADAIEGFENSIKKFSNSKLNKDVEELKKRLQDRIDNKKKVLLFSSTRLWWQAAASIIVLFGAGVLTWYYLNTKTLNKNIAQSFLKSNHDSLMQTNKEPATPLATDTISNKAKVVGHEQVRKEILQPNSGKKYTPRLKENVAGQKGK